MARPRVSVLYELLSASCVDCNLCSSYCPWYPLFRPPLRNAGLREAVESCTMCGRCVLHCPLKVPTHKAVFERKLKGYIAEDLKSLREVVERKGHTFGVDMDWNAVRNAGFPVDEEAEWLFLPGGFDALPTSREDFFSLLWVLKELGYDFTLSSEVPEGYGNFLFDMADPRYFVRKAKHVLKVARDLGVKGLVLSECGADYKVWPRLKDFVGLKSDLKVVTAVELIERRLKERHVVRKLKGKTSYHDPCGLGRYNFLINEPRKILKIISEEYVERGPSGKDQLCCGGGGGVSLSEKWKRKAVETIGPKKVMQFKGVDRVVTACAKCKSMLWTYSLLKGGRFRVHRLGYVIAWSMGREIPEP